MSIVIESAPFVPQLQPMYTFKSMNKKYESKVMPHSKAWFRINPHFTAQCKPGEERSVDRQILKFAEQHGIDAHISVNTIMFTWKSDHSADQFAFRKMLFKHAVKMRLLTPKFVSWNSAGTMKFGADKCFVVQNDHNCAMLTFVHIGVCDKLEV